MYTERLHDLYSLPSVINDLEKRRDENCAVLGYYAASSGNSLPAFRDNLSVPPAKVKNSKRKPNTTHVNDLTKENKMGKTCSTYGEN